MPSSLQLGPLPENAIFLDQVTEWFTDGLDYSYSPEVHGTPCDWLLDLVSVGFHNQSQPFHHGLGTFADVVEASTSYRERYASHCRLSLLVDTSQILITTIMASYFHAQCMQRHSPVVQSFPWLMLSKRTQINPAVAWAEAIV